MLNLDNFTLALLDAASAVFCFLLVWFMAKPYRFTGDRRYVGLPFAFSFLGVSLSVGVFRYLEPNVFVNFLRWIQLFTQSYAFVFLAVTYYFSNKEQHRTRLLLDLTYAAIIIVASASYVILIISPANFLHSFIAVDGYMRILNIACLSYIAVYTLRSHVAKPDPKTIWIPMSYLLLDFSQYSFLIMAIDSEFAASIGGHFLRILGLLILVIVAYQTFYTSTKKYVGKENA